MKFARLVLCLAVFVAAPALLAAQAKNENPHGTLKEECATCHRSEGWTPVRISKAFNHGKLGYALTGAHGTTACRACHQTLDFKGTSTDCASCHKDVHRGELGADCSKCHTTRSYLDRTVMTRAHQTTRFPLEGAHLAAECGTCHAPTAQGTQRFVSRQTTCVSCHQADYASAKDPDHATGGFPRECQTCHAVTVWTRAKFDHNATRFQLTGAHRAVVCNQCHVGNKYTGTRGDCVACHQTDYTAAAQPSHTAAQLPTDCVLCHSTASWNANYDHSQTRFPLDGAHKAVPCMDCHKDNVYHGKPTDCLSCHTKDYNNSADPPHKTAGFPTDCVSCHTVTGWSPSSFDHNASSFPLTGAHKAVACNDCHADKVYNGKPTACVSCHQTDYNNAADPNHRTAQFPTDCATCHTVNAWNPATFDHNATNFPLNGAHKAVTCHDCHADNVYKGKPTACVSCHQTDYNNAADPNHRTAQFPTDCLVCHTVNAWSPASFDHNASSFPLTGAHRAVACNDCHADHIYNGKSIECVSCHQTDYNNAVDPNHRTAQFPTTCTPCHTTTAWVPASFNHSTTSFPLTGTHTTTPCADCHGDGVYNGKPTTCESCHRTDYNQATSPNHTTLGWPTTCITCHSGSGSTTAWDQGVTLPTQYHTMFSVNHEKARGDCTQCHVTANYSQSTCSTHHHPATCTFTNQRACGD
ncbi:MAG: hypothetical protein U0133_07375 [Gemmatimonadales bacterium]